MLYPDYALPWNFLQGSNLRYKVCIFKGPIKEKKTTRIIIRMVLCSHGRGHCFSHPFAIIPFDQVRSLSEWDIGQKASLEQCP